MILGELVNLRAVDLDDVRVVYRWLNDPVVMDGWGDSAATISQSRVTRKIAGWLDDEEKLGRPVGFVIERLDGDAIGLLLASPTDQEQRVFQLSLLIGDPDEWGKGFGRDALDAFSTLRSMNGMSGESGWRSKRATIAPSGSIVQPDSSLKRRFAAPGIVMAFVRMCGGSG